MLVYYYALRILFNILSMIIMGPVNIITVKYFVGFHQKWLLGDTLEWLLCFVYLQGSNIEIASM